MTGGRSSVHRAAGDAFVELVAVMDRLRTECAWKSAQTHHSLLRFLIEEAYEVLEAAETGTAEDLREELGDLLLQVVFHARVAEEGPDGRTPFDVGEVIDGITAKLRRRNPHVFEGSDEVVADLPPIDRNDPAAVNQRWEQVKAREKSREGVMDGVPTQLPALLMGLKAVERLERAGLAVQSAVADPPTVDRLADDTPDETAIGERLWQTVVDAHAVGIDPEQAMRAAVRRRAALAAGTGDSSSARADQGDTSS